jgi:hypothetical protein
MTTATQLIPAKVAAAWRSAKAGLAQIEQQHVDGGPPELLEQYAKAKAAYNAWRKPEQDYKAAQAALAQWREHGGRNLDLARGNVHLAVESITAPIAKRLRTMMDRALGDANNVYEPAPGRAAERHKKLLQAMRRLERISEEPGDDIEEILQDILSSAGVNVDELLGDVAAINQSQVSKPVRHPIGM